VVQIVRGSRNNAYYLSTLKTSIMMMMMMMMMIVQQPTKTASSDNRSSHGHGGRDILLRKREFILKNDTITVTKQWVK